MTPPMPWLSRKLLWLDKRRNVDRIVGGLAAVCAALVVAGLFTHGHGVLDRVPGFYGAYGFIMCALLVLTAKGLRLLLGRPADYYAAADAEAAVDTAADAEAAVDTGADEAAAGDAP